jgi:choline dehydrogenase-like flavoprotein
MTHARMPVIADVAVIGAGPAGIAAAARAAEAGRPVHLLDEQPNAGGQIWRHRARSSLGGTARRWIERLSRSAAQVHHGVSVVDVIANGGDGGWTIVTERQGTARSTSCGEGAGDRDRRARAVRAVPGWTLPGVYGIGGAQALLKQGATFRGKRWSLPEWPTHAAVAASMTEAGARVQLVADRRVSRRCSTSAVAARQPGHARAGGDVPPRVHPTPYATERG